MGWYRLDIYRRSAKKPYDRISFKARDRAKAGDHADRHMARRPGHECGLLYDLELTRDRRWRVPRHDRGWVVMRDNTAAIVVLLALVIGVGGLGTDSFGSDSSASRVSAACDTEPRRGLSDEQMGNAAAIAAVGVDMDMPDRAVVVALATAMQESGLRNLDHGDRDSLGLFQQRPSQGWGTSRQVRDPEYAARKFYQALRRVDGWERMRVTEAAQAVQISAFPEAYQQHVGMAEDVAGVLIPCVS